MSYDLELAVERVIERMRGIAKARRVPMIGSVSADTFNSSETWLAAALDEMAAELDQPLRAIRDARERERQRHDTRRWLGLDQSDAP